MGQNDKSQPEIYDFYGAIRNSQPIAFLASLSFVIAALVFRQGEEQSSIYNAAVTAAVLFILSFVASIANQLPIFRTQKRWTDMVSFATYFFFGLGILYWIVIAYQFSKEQLQISTSVASFTVAFIGSIAIYGFYSMIKKIRKSGHTEHRAITDFIMTISLLISGIFFMILAGQLIAKSIGMTEAQPLFEGLLVVFATISLGVFTVISIPTELLRARKSKQKKSPI